jgi:triacylglycerol lipase
MSLPLGSAPDRSPGPSPAATRAPASPLSRAVGATGAAARALLTPRGMAGVAVEAAWNAAHLAVYPLGLLRDRHRDPDDYRLEGLGPVQRGLLVGDVEAAGTPILLLHGMVDNRSIFSLLRRGLRRKGFGRVLTLNYSPVTNDVRAAAQGLADEIESICARTGYERLHVVGHSLGGLIARYYVQRLGGDARVHTLVTLGTPHAGTRMAHLLSTELTRQLRPGSDLLRELAAPQDERCRTRFIAYWSDLDQMVVPQRNGRVVHPGLHVRNHLVRGAGHMSLPVSSRLVHEITAALCRLDSDGTVSEHGVTAIR